MEWQTDRNIQIFCRGIDEKAGSFNSNASQWREGKHHFKSVKSDRKMKIPSHIALDLMAREMWQHSTEDLLSSLLMQAKRIVNTRAGADK